ncbi:MAG: hypothetical protein ABR600_05760 [Actinomycetota bacterium]
MKRLTIRVRASAVLAAVIVVAALAPPSPASTSSDTTGLPSLPVASQRRVAQARALVREIRAAMDGDTIASRVGGLITASGRAVPTPVLVRPVATDATALSAFPAPLRAPIAVLEATLHRSAAMFRAIPAPVLRWARQHQVAPSRAPTAFGTFSVRRTKPAHPGVPRPVLRRPSVHAPAWVRAHPGLADRAAMSIATALDGALPALRAAAASLPAVGATVDGCDLLDETPNLCIGGMNDNVYTKDAELLIDLGGNDAYHNSVAAANFANPNGQFGPPVGIAVDLGGNDVYDPPPLTYPGSAIPGSGWREVIGEGVARNWGVGILVDGGGNDRYLATAGATDADHLTSRVFAQGVAAAVLPSFGGLFDLGGNDSYGSVGASGTDDIELHAQGAANGLGSAVGGLVDAGIGNDSYTIDAGTAVDATAPPAAWPMHFAIGQGYGNIGTGVLVDGGGTDSFSLAAHGKWVTTDGYPFVSLDTVTQLPLAEVSGQGVGGIGDGFLIEGAGDTTYAADVTSEGIAFNSIGVQGIGSSGVGVLDDPSGNDTYRAVSTLTHDRTVTVDDSCTEPDPDTGEPVPCRSATAFVHAYNTANFAQLSYAQGFGYLGGQGILHDAAGNDTYRSVVSSSLQTSLHDAMTAPDAPARFDVWGYGVQWNIGQGVGQGEGADGVLLDETGNDSYLSRSSTDTVASATSDHGPGTPRVTALAPYRDGVWAQGVGYGLGPTGALLDLGGTGDHFEVTSVDSLSTSPDTGGDLKASLGWPIAMGGSAAGNATGVFEALGQSPSLFVSPARGVCPGSPPRGFGGWVDCAAFGEDPDHQPIDSKAETPAYGLAPFSSGKASTLAFTPDTPGQGTVGFRLSGDPPFDTGSTVRVGATLQGPDGKPLAGKLVHFDLNGLRKLTTPIDTSGYQAWVTMWESDAVTDANGMATTTIPLEDMTQWGVKTNDYDFRLLATFDGGPGLYPAHGVKPFQLTS